MNPTIKHIWERLLHPAVIIIVIGCLAVLVAIGTISSKKSGSSTTNSAEVEEGASVSVSVPKDVSLPSPVTATFYDQGEHGFIAVQSGGGMYMTYDPATGLSYKAEATLAGSDASGQKFTFNVPEGICGYVVKSDLEPNPPPKVVTVTLTGPDGKPIPGAPTESLAIKCDTYTLSVKTVVSKDPVLPDGADQSKITATLTVTGPAQWINGTRIKPGGQKIILTTPLGLVFVNFTTDLGVLAPNPSKLKTALDGTASVTITSKDAGIASVRAAALAVGDAKEQIHFKPKITAVKMNFVQPVSPTNYELKTIPANAKDIDFTWGITFAGPPCGSMTGALAGKNLTKNGYYHGPAGTRTEGCQEENEKASKITVTVTDKDGQTDSKTFGARAYEGQGFVNLK